MALEDPIVNDGLSPEAEENFAFCIAALEVTIEIARTAEKQLREVVAPLVLDADLHMQIPHRASQYALDAQLLTENVADLRNRLVRWRDAQNSQPTIDVADETGL